MNTLDLQSAAAFLHIHPVTLQEKARAGEIPGAKIGNGTATVQCTRTGVAAGRPGRGACVGLCGSIQEPQTNRGAIERYGTGRAATATR